MPDIQQQINSDLDKFGELSSDAGKLLHDTAGKIEKGYPPGASDITDISASLKGLRQLYENICSLIASESPSSNILSRELPANELRKLAASVNESVEQAKKDLQRFMQVRSSMPEFNAGIEPLQDKAAKLLTRLEAPNLSGGAKKAALSEADKYQKFLAMMDIEITRGNIGISMELSKVFPAFVLMGLAGNHYYIEGSDKQLDSTPQSELDESQEPEPEPQQQQDISPVQEITPADDAPETAGTLLARSPIKPQKPGVSVFKRELIKPSAGEPKPWRESLISLFNIFTHYGALTLGQAFSFWVYYDALREDRKDKERREYITREISARPKDDVQTVTGIIEWLERKSAASLYPHDDEIICCLTKWAYGSLAKQDIRKMFKVLLPGNSKFYGGEEISESAAMDIIRRNDAVIRYLDAVMRGLNLSRYTSILNGLKFSGDDFIAPVFWEGVEHKCRLIYSVREAERMILSGGLAGEVLAVTDESPEEVNNILTRINEAERDKIFVLDEALHRGLAEIHDDDIDDGDDETDDETSPGESETQTQLSLFLEFDTPPESDSLPAPAKHEPDPTPITQEPTTDSESMPSTPQPATDSESEPLTPQLTDDSESEPSMPQPTTDSAPMPLTPESPGHDTTDILPSDDEAIADIRALLAQPDSGEGEIPFAPLAEAYITAKAASLHNDHDESAQMFTRLDMAGIAVPYAPEYTGAALAVAFPPGNEGDTITEGLMLAAYMNGMISPAEPWSDYVLRAKIEELNAEYDSFFPSFREAKRVFSRMSEFYLTYNIFPEGFLESVNSQGNEADTPAKVKADAETLLSLPPFNTQLKVLPCFSGIFFGSESELHSYISAVCNNDLSARERVREFVAKYYGSSERVTGAKLKDEIDTAWAETHRRLKRKFSPLIAHLRNNVIHAAHIRLEVLHRWITLNDSASHDYDKKPYITARENILSAISEALPNLVGKPGKSAVMNAIMHIRRVLNSENDPEPFAILLTNGIIPIDGDNQPILGSTDIKYYEPLRNVARFRNTPRLTLVEAEAAILNDESSHMYENLRQYELIRRLRGEDSDLGDDADRAREAAEKYTEDFRIQLMTDYAFGRISEDDAETFKSLITANEYIMELGDFGCWREFLRAIRHQADDITEQSRERVMSAIHSCADNYALESGITECPKELTEAMRLTESGSFSAAESRINAFESARAMGVAVSEIHTERTEIDAFRRFMDSFSAIYAECDKPKNKEKALKTFGRSYIEDNPPDDWPELSRKLRDERTALLENWPSRLGNTSTEQIRAVLNGLGFTVAPENDAVTRDNTHTGISNMEIFTARMRKNDGRSCSHPIARFGTKLETLNVFVLYGSGTPGKIADSIMDIDPGTSILLMDYHVNIPSRNQFAKAFRTHSRQDRYFLMADRVLALFIARHDASARLNVLLQCALPYTSCSPFTKGSGPVAPEMFYGRERELADIRNPHGSSVVYGGRQLGKTSLLRRAETLEHQPAKFRYAIYNDLASNGLKDAFRHGYDEAKMVECIIASVNAKIPGLLDESSSTLQEMCRNISDLITAKKAESFLLLLDEADAFLEALRDESYEPLRPLVDLRNATENKFKFVIAGLHNVMRAKNSAADNNPLGQLGPALCVRPLSPYEAQRLLLEPLEYLGFRIDPERHLETMLTATNYYPGVIQYLGYILLEKFTERCDSSGAEELSPPFTADDSLLGSVIGSQELTDYSAKTLKLSLGLDNDKYMMLGQCIAYLHYTGGGESFGGYTAGEIAAVDGDLTHCMTGETYEAYDSVLSEMADMGILSKLPGGKYRFRRLAFIKYIWPDEDSVLRTGE
ncbi:MAG: hypothetical protein IJP89_01535 [Synergistaceae bacterium]|nr:hypothetical protein [Synergistaceae bacterium]